VEWGKLVQGSLYGMERTIFIVSMLTVQTRRRRVMFWWAKWKSNGCPPLPCPVEDLPRFERERASQWRKVLSSQSLGDEIRR